MPDILSYLHYLHDVNRKLLQRGGLENGLYRKPVSQHPYYHPLDQPDPNRPRHWLGSLRHIENAQARGLMLRPLVGLGLVVGQLDTPKGLTARLQGAEPWPARLGERRRQLVAGAGVVDPGARRDAGRRDRLHLVLRDPELSRCLGPSRHVVRRRGWSDLLEHVLHGQAQDDDPDEDGNRIPQVGVGGGTPAVFTEVENDLERWANDGNPDARFALESQLKTMKYIRDTVPDFRSVSISTVPYDHRLLDTLVQKRPPVFFPHRFFFVARAAGELTTMTALAALIRQTEGRVGDAV